MYVLIGLLIDLMKILKCIKFYLVFQFVSSMNFRLGWIYFSQVVFHDGEKFEPSYANEASLGKIKIWKSKRSGISVQATQYLHNPIR